MRLALTACVLFTLLAGGAAAEPARPSAARSLAALVGEQHSYTLDFLMFKDLAEGSLRLVAEKEAGRYRAELTAQTLGVASWLSGDRVQRYVSIMEEDGRGGLRSVSHLSAIRKKSWGKWKDKQKRYRFDYRAGKVYQEKGEGGNFNPGLVFELPAGEAPVDILTGFYNLRIGVYGALTPGARITIPTFTTKGISSIDVEVMTGPQRQARKFFPATGTLLKVRVDPEVFDTGGSDLYAWFDDAGRPARGIVEKVIGLGDVYGRLREEPKQP